MSSLRKNILKRLEKKGSYSPDVNDFFVDELITNIELSQDCLRQISLNVICEQYEHKQGNFIIISRMNPLSEARI